jgi:diguanylate cyclase (GGDEF)-like protein/PAS domain S-box-containing protein
LRKKDRPEVALFMMTTSDYQTLFQETGDPICILDRTDAILNANPAWLEMIGSPNPEEARSPFLSLLLSEDKEKTARVLGDLRSGETSTRLTIRCRDTLGDIRWLDMHAFSDANQDKIFVICRDVTHNHSFREIIERSRRQFMALVDSIDDAFFAVDGKGHFSYVNDHAEALLSSTREEMLGRPVHTFFTESDSPKFSRQLNRAIAERASATFTQYHPPVARWLNCSIYSYSEGHTVYLRDVTEAIERERALEKMASRDHLTDIYNRRTGLDLLEKQMTIADQKQHPLTVLYVDINNLKITNDRLGHRTGDRLIIDTCEMIKTQLRTSDFFCRVGGDEFLIVLPGTNEAGAEEFRDRTLGVLARRNEELRTSGDPVRLSISVGIATYDHRLTVEQLIDRADQAMYEDKRRRKPKNPFSDTTTG